MSKKNKNKHKNQASGPSGSPHRAESRTADSRPASTHHSPGTHEASRDSHPHRPHLREPVTPGKIIAYAVVGSALTMFLAANIVYSQIVNPVWERMTNGDRVAQVQFFKIIKDMPVFAELRDLTSGTYATLQQDINADDVTRKDKIAKMEALLEENPDNPDLLYAISTMYRDGGDEPAADEYLQRARRLDPLIGK